MRYQHHRGVISVASDFCLANAKAFAVSINRAIAQRYRWCASNELWMETNKLLLSKVRNNLRCKEWTSVVEVYQPLIASWLTRFGGAPQEIADITQDVLCIVVRELPKFVHNGRTGAFRSWLRTITVNRLRQHWKQESHRKVVNAELNDQVLEMLANPESEISISWNLEHDKHVLDRVLERVSREFDATTMLAFRKFVLDGQDGRVVAREMGLSAGQIYKYKFRVMKRLRSLVQSLSEQGLDSIFSSVVDEMGRTGASGDLLSA